MTTRTTRTLATAAALAALALPALAGCASGSSGDASGGSSSGSTSADKDSAAAGSASQLADSAYAADAPHELARKPSAPGAKARPQPGDLVARTVVRTGDVAMQAADVGRARFEVQRVADRYRGEITEESTESGGDGKPAYSRLVLRIPVADFDRAVEALGGIGTDPSVSTSAEDVTTQLIDLRTRVAAQRRSIARITVLFDRATSIRDVMAIEAELSRRQADLESLERKNAYVSSQAAMSTITVSIDRRPSAHAEHRDDAGFLSGLAAGWDALAAAALAAATVAGALVPWLAVAALVAVPAWLLLRSRRRQVSG